MPFLANFKFQMREMKPSLKNLKLENSSKINQIKNEQKIVVYYYFNLIELMVFDYFENW